MPKQLQRFMVKFDYVLGMKTKILIEASADDVHDYSADNLVLEFYDELSQPLEVKFDNEIFADIEDLAITKLKIAKRDFTDETLYC